MLSLNDIIKNLEPNQINIENKINNEKKINNKIILNNFYDFIFESKNYYKINNKMKNSIISAVLGICDETFLLYNNNEKNIIIKKLINQMCDDLDEKYYYKKFGYTRKKQFKKQIIKEKLLNNNIDFDEIVNDNLKQYLADYFNINIIIFIFDEHQNYIGSNFYKYGVFNKKNEQCVTNILIEKYENNYHPILNNEQNNILTLSKNRDILNNIIKFVPELIINAKKIEEIKKLEDIEYDITNKKSLMKLKLDIIKQIAIKNNIELKKISEKNGKLINLRKEEIIDNILLINN